MVAEGSLYVNTGNIPSRDSLPIWDQNLWGSRWIGATMIWVISVLSAILLMVIADGQHEKSKLKIDVRTPIQR